MARLPRVDFPGAVHHVYARGIEKRKIYLDDEDRVVFLGRVKFNLARWKVCCFAWALLENHFHLLVQCREGGLSSFMRCLLTAYSMYFNERYRRVGHLFQNRYKSRIVAKDSYLRQVIRYIHLNPARAGHIRSLESLEIYPWTGHRQIMEGGDSCWMDVDLLQGLFHGSEKVDWRANYRDFIAGGYAACLPAEEESGDDPAFLLDDDDSVGRPHRHDQGPPKAFFDIVDRVSAQNGISREQILGRGRSHFEVDARRAVLLACRRRMAVSAALVSRWLGISETSGNYLLRTQGDKRRYL